MKTTMMTVIVVAVMTVSGMAETVKARVPFEFGAQKAKLTAGTYEVVATQSMGGAKSYAIRNIATGTGALVIASPLTADEAQRPHLKFDCPAAGDCMLSEMWVGARVGYKFAIPKRAGDAKHEVRVVELKQ